MNAWITVVRWKALRWIRNFLVEWSTSFSNSLDWPWQSFFFFVMLTYGSSCFPDLQNTTMASIHLMICPNCSRWSSSTNVLLAPSSRWIKMNVNWINTDGTSMKVMVSPNQYESSQRLYEAHSTPPATVSAMNRTVEMMILAGSFARCKTSVGELQSASVPSMLPNVSIPNSGSKLTRSEGQEPPWTRRRLQKVHTFPSRSARNKSATNYPWGLQFSINSNEMMENQFKNKSRKLQPLPLWRQSNFLAKSS